MSSTDQRDLADDPVERLLRDDAQQWRSAHDAPSLEHAVRRLGDASTARRAGWWRPVGVAAALLLLIGGAVGVAARHPIADEPIQASPAATSTKASDAAVPTLTTLPPGFVEVSGRVPSPMDAARGSTVGHPRSVVLRSWVGSRTIPRSPAPPFQESFILSSVGVAVSVHGTTTVQGDPAELQEQVWPSGNAGDATVITVLWNVEGRALQLVYSGPGPHDYSARALSAAQVVAVADGFSADPPPAHTFAVALPMTLHRGSVTLQLARTRSFVARRTQNGGLEVQLGAGPGADPTTASYCTPYEEAVLTGAESTSVTVTVGEYVPPGADPTPKCITIAYPTRWVPVALEGPLGSRTVIDGSTGKPVSPPVR